MLERDISTAVPAVKTPVKHGVTRPQEMMKNVTYKKMRNGDENKTFSIVKDGFHEFVEGDLTEAGTSEFFRSTREMIFDNQEGHTVFVVGFNGEIIGMIDVRNTGHVCLFFVKKSFHGLGVGRQLMEIAQSHLNQQNNRGVDLDVNSSIFAVNMYEKLGFKKLKDVQTVNGIKFVPMLKKSAG